MTPLRPAVLLDRDGILVEDVDALVSEDQVRVMPGAAAFLALARSRGFASAVVSNQTVVARGLATEERVRAVNARIQALLEAEGSGPIDRYYFCPHHPEATVAAYRMDCECRKPRPGMLLTAARELGLDLARSVMIGDRMSDIVAGSHAGCVTILVQSGRHADAPIMSRHHDPAVRPDHVCTDMAAAAAILSGKAP